MFGVVSQQISSIVFSKERMFKIMVKIKITVVKYMHKISQRLHPFYVLLGFAQSKTPLQIGSAW